MGEPLNVQSSSVSPEHGSLAKLRAICGFCGAEMVEDKWSETSVRHPQSESCLRSGAFFSLTGWMHQAVVVIGDEFEPIAPTKKSDLQLSRRSQLPEPLVFRSIDDDISRIVASSELLTALTCRLIFAARALAQSNILVSDYLSISEGVIPGGNQVCLGCTMHSHARKLTHTPSCSVGDVLSILDRMCEAQANTTAAVDDSGCRKEEARTEEARAEVRMPSRVDANNANDYGEPWRYREGAGGMPRLENSEGYQIARMLGSSQEAIDHAERIVACVNFCAGIPTEMLLNQKPLADMTRDISQVIAAGRLLPGLKDLRTSQGVAR